MVWDRLSQPLGKNRILPRGVAVYTGANIQAQEYRRKKNRLSCSLTMSMYQKLLKGVKLKTVK